MRITLSLECPWCHDRFPHEIDVAVYGRTRENGVKYAEGLVSNIENATHRCAEVTVVEP